MRPAITANVESNLAMLVGLRIALPPPALFARAEGRMRRRVNIMKNKMKIRLLHHHAFWLCVAGVALGDRSAAPSPIPVSQSLQGLETDES